MPSRANTFLFLYIAFSVLHLIVEANGWIMGVYLTKPLLMPLLAAYFLWSQQREISAIRQTVIMALFFSTAGDVFLMLEGYADFNTSLFVPGLGSFLLAHIFYILTFNKIAKNSWAYLSGKPIYLIALFTYLISILFFLWPDLPKGLNIAVVIYSCCIMLMAAAALNTRPQLSSFTYLILIIGVFSFIFSDTVIALNKFKASQLSVPFPRLIIMSFYLLGQGLIVEGVSRWMGDGRTALRLS